MSNQAESNLRSAAIVFSQACTRFRVANQAYADAPAGHRQILIPELDAAMSHRDEARARLSAAANEYAVSVDPLSRPSA